MITNAVSTVGIWTLNGFELATVERWRGSSTTILKTIATGLCGTDLHVLRGTVEQAPLPVSLGHEIFAEVERVGPTTQVLEAGELRPGERVVVVPDIACGACSTCLTYGPLGHPCDNKQVHGFSRFEPEHHSALGGFSTFIELIDEIPVLKVPAEMPMERAVLGEVLAVAVRAVERGLVTGRPDVGFGALVAGSAAVIGLGPVGCCVALTLQSLGLQVTGFECNEWRAQYANDVLGIETLQVGHGSEATVQAARSVGRNEAFDLVIECAGEPDAFASALQIVRKEGKVVVLGHYMSNGRIDVDPSVICRKDLEVLGSGLTPPISYIKALHLLAKSSLPFEKLVTERLPLAEIKMVPSLIAQRKYMKLVIVP